MIPSLLSKLIILLFGTLYPAYASYKAVKTKNVKEYVKWMMYWIVFALFTSAETLTDIFFSFWFPFYYELKIMLVLYLLSPATNGSSILYRKFVHPMLSRKEQEIDEYIAKAMEQGYHTMLNLGSRMITYMTSIIMQTAIRGGGGLVNHIRKSYSLDDMNTHEARNRRITDGSDEPDEVEAKPLMRQRRVKNRSPMRMSSGSQVDLYFSDMDNTMGKDRPRAMRSSEDFSSGYGSPDPTYTRINGRDPLHRTGSMGPTTRARSTRVASEDESGCSTTEPEESQYETDDGFPMSFPPFHPSLAHFVKPEYRYLFASLTQQQADTLVNNASCLEPVKGVTPPSTVLRSIMAERKVVDEPVMKRHKKRQAPVPPEKEEESFRTPDESPVPVRKVIVPDLVDTTEEEEEEESDQKTTEKTENKIEKVDDKTEEKTDAEEKKKIGKVGKESQITKMLHLSKIHIPFWNQKSGKHSPVQESSGGLPRNNSHASLASQESYISLKGDESVEESAKNEPERQMSVREMSQSPSSKRRSLVTESQ